MSWHQRFMQWFTRAPSGPYWVERPDCPICRGRFGQNAIRHVELTPAGKAVRAQGLRLDPQVEQQLVLAEWHHEQSERYSRDYLVRCYERGDADEAERILSWLRPELREEVIREADENRERRRHFDLFMKAAKVPNTPAWHRVQYLDRIEQLATISVGDDQSSPSESEMAALLAQADSMPGAAEIDLRPFPPDDPGERSRARQRLADALDAAGYPEDAADLRQCDRQ
jgi:hypothetical protein